MSNKKLAWQNRQTGTQATGLHVWQQTNNNSRHLLQNCALFKRYTPDWFDSTTDQKCIENEPETYVVAWGKATL